MMRALVLLLVLLNGVYFAWGQGWLSGHGVGPASQQEPHRLTEQIRPESLQVVSLAEAAKPKVAPNTTQCLISGTLDDSGADAARAALTPLLPEKSWALEVTESAERWIIYMGKYANTAELAKKRAQLQDLKLTAEVLRSPALTPGLSLGAFATKDQAEAGLKVLAGKGVKTARVVQETPGKRSHQLRLLVAEDTLQLALPVLKTALPGLTFAACPA